MGEIMRLDPPYPPQVEFYRATSKYIAYGGARGGGKSHAARVKASLLALNYAGLQILLLRRTLAELRENHTLPLQKMLKGIAEYRDKTKEFVFANGSRIILGYCKAESDVLQYQGQAYDVIFMEEATHFTEFQFETLTESNRSSGMCKEKFNPRMYFTCNPGGVGHLWVKRLFIDRQYRNKEKPEDYTFIKATVYDNLYLMENSPDYVRTLENLPEARRKAMLYGDWNVFEGQYFSMWNPDIHVIRPFVLPEHWRRYVTFDYGRDMLAAYWIAVDTQGAAYVYKEIYRPDLLVGPAIEAIKAMTTETISEYFAPPDMWNTHNNTGMSTAEYFRDAGIYLTRAQNDRVMGWYDLAEWLNPMEDERGRKVARLRVFENCVNLIRTLPALQFDDKNPNDCAIEPHEITHAPDAIRYFVAGRPRPTKVTPPPIEYAFDIWKPKPNPLGKGGKINVI